MTNRQKLSIVAFEKYHARVDADPAITQETFSNLYVIGLVDGLAVLRSEFLEEKEASHAALNACSQSQNLEHKIKARDWAVRIAALNSLGVRMDQFAQWLIQEAESEIVKPSIHA